MEFLKLEPDEKDNLNIPANNCDEIDGIIIFKTPLKVRLDIWGVFTDGRDSIVSGFDENDEFFVYAISSTKNTNSCLDKFYDDEKWITKNCYLFHGIAGGGLTFVE